MKGISTVSILILTVFLSMSVLPAACDTVPPLCPNAPYPVTGYAYYADGTAADGAVVTVYLEGDQSKCITTTAGSSGVSPAFYKFDASNIGITTADVGKTLIVEIDDGVSSIGSGRLNIADLPTDPDAASPQVTDITIVTPSVGGGGGSGGDGTYPPGWGETPTIAPTPDATAAPASTDATEPSGTTVAEDVAVAAEETPTKDETDDTKTPMKTDPGTPGFGAVCMITGLLAAVYLVLRRRE
ncbi:MAG: PGF-CTERM sorting domain-containing protein [Euryarchaeota archaeon]|nr:PGF-CTERM sorting domain-containing protein [Euryarchaeota archaeon]